jgi:ABC-2 type transport system permease protein
MPEVLAGAAPGRAEAGAWSLLRPKWQMARNRARQHQRGDLRRVTVVSAVVLGFWTVAFALALRLLRYFRGAEDIGDLLAAKLLAMILLSFGSILLLSNTIAALSNFFLSRDLDQLAAAPVRSGALYRARLAETALHSSWMVALLLVPLLGAYGVAYRGGPDFVLFAIAVFVPSRLSASPSPIVVVVLPSPALVGLIAVTRIRCPGLRPVSAFT